MATPFTEQLPPERLNDIWLQNWEVDELGLGKYGVFFRGKKGPFRRKKKKKGLSDTPASQAGGTSRQAPAWPPAGFLSQCVTSYLGLDESRLGWGGGGCPVHCICRIPGFYQLDANSNFPSCGNTKWLQNCQTSQGAKNGLLLRTTGLETLVFGITN